MSGMIIKTNLLAMNAHRNLKGIGANQSKASERLSSGLRINRAADDAAGLAISEKMQAQIRGLEHAQQNTEDGINVCKTMDGGMSEISDMMIRQRELIVQALNDTNTDEDRKKIQLEIDQLTEEIGALAEKTTFNNIPLLNVPSKIADKTVQVTTPGFWQPQAPIWTTPLVVYEVFQTNYSLENLESNLTTVLFNENYETQFRLFDGTNLFSDIRFNIESILKNQDTGAINDWNNFDPGIHSFGDLSFSEFVRNELYNPATAGQFENKAQYFAERIADALTSGFKSHAGVDQNIGIKGEFNTTTRRVTFTINHPNPAITVKGFDSVGCRGDGLLGSFGHELLHLRSSPDIITEQPIPGSEEYVYQEDIWIPERIDIITVRGSERDPLWIQNGANGGQGVYVDRYDCRPESLYEEIFDPNSITINVNGTPMEVTLTNLVTSPWEEATASLIALDAVFGKINEYRANAGVQQNRLEFSVNFLGVARTNLEDSQSRIKDADMAKEMMNLTKFNVLQQAGTAMLAQANQAPQSVLQLLQ